MWSFLTLRHNFLLVTTFSLTSFVFVFAFLFAIRMFLLLVTFVPFLCQNSEKSPSELLF